MAQVSVIIPAAGQSSRFQQNGTKKTLLRVHDLPVWAHAVKPFRQRSDVKQIIVVVPPNDLNDFYAEFGRLVKVWELTIVAGGSNRSISVANGFHAVLPDCERVAIHDGARPCVDSDLIERVFAAAAATGAAIPAVPVNSTLKKVSSENQILATVNREGLYLAQTPQVFSRLHLARMIAASNNRLVTDDAQLAEILGIPVTIVPGSISNIKITQKQDIEFAEIYLGKRRSIDS